MTQDQYGQARGDVVEDETDDYPADQSKPMTRFEKVASALRGDRGGRDEADEMAMDDEADPDTTGGPASGARRDDYWEVPNAREDQVATVTNPDVTDPDLPVTGANADPLGTGPDATDGLDPARTEPDNYGTSPDDGYALPEDTFAGDPVTGGTAAGDPVTGDRAGAVTISDDEAARPREDTVAEVPGGAGRHAAAPEELHPGEAGTLDDLGDLAYGKLIPDAADFTAQWQQIQFRFVDDPQASVTEAAEVVSQVTAKLEAAIAERQRAIAARQEAIAERQRTLRDRWGEGTQADTETLRETLRMYRAFLDQLIGPKA